MTDYKIAPLTWLRTKFAELNHTHDDRYYTESEINRKLIILDDSTNNASNFQNIIGTSQTYGSAGEIFFGRLGYSIDEDLIFYEKGDGLVNDEIATRNDIPNINGKENVNNKVTFINENSNDNQYPSAKAVYNRYDNLMEQEEIYSFDGDGKDKIINKKIFKDGFISFNVDLTTLYGSAYIRIGNDENNYIRFGFFDSDWTTCWLFDDLIGDEYQIKINEQKVINIKIKYPNVDIYQNGNTGAIGDVYDYNLIIYIDDIERIFNNSYTLVEDNEVRFFDRNIFKSVIEDDNHNINTVIYDKLLYEEIPIKFTYEDDTEETIRLMRSLR